MAKDIIRLGKISSINFPEGTVRVTYGDKNNAVTQELPLLSFEYDMPNVGDLVYVAHLSNGVENGVILGKYYNKKNKPTEHGAHIFRKELGEEAFFKYDRKTKTLTINVENVVFTGDVTIKGKTVLESGLEAAGAFSASESGGVVIESNLTVKSDTEIEKDMNVKGRLMRNGVDVQ